MNYNKIISIIVNDKTGKAKEISLRLKVTLSSLLLSLLILVIWLFLKHIQLKSMRAEIESAKSSLNRYMEIHAQDSIQIDSLNSRLYYSPDNLFQTAKNIIDSTSPLKANSTLAINNLEIIIYDLPENPYQASAQRLLKSFKISMLKDYNNLIAELNKSDIKKRISELRALKNNSDLYYEIRNLCRNKIYEYEFNLIKSVYKNCKDSKCIIESLNAIISDEFYSDYFRRRLMSERDAATRIYISASNLSDAYNSNPIKAQQDYANKKIYIEGEIQKILPQNQYDRIGQLVKEVFDLNLPYGGTFVNLKGTNGYTVRCYVNSVEEVINLNKGDKIKVSGIFNQELFKLKITKDLLKNTKLDISDIVPDMSSSDIFLINCSIETGENKYTYDEHDYKLDLIFYDEVDLTYNRFIERIKLFYRTNNQTDINKILTDLDKNGLVILDLLKRNFNPSKYNKRIGGGEYKFEGTWKSTSGNKFSVELIDNKLVYYNLKSKQKFLLKKVGNNIYHVEGGIAMYVPLDNKYYFSLVNSSAVRVFNINGRLVHKWNRS